MATNKEPEADTLSALIHMGPEAYDRVFASRTELDLPFWRKRCREAAGRGSGRILEVACGTGRLTIPLAAEGSDISGLDLLPPMLEEARRKAAAEGLSIPWHQEDCRDFDLGERFSMIFIPFNSITALLTNQDLLAFFGRVRAHLEADGRFLFDMYNPSVEILARDPAQEYDVCEYADPEDATGGTVITVKERHCWDVATQQIRQRWLFRWGDTLLADTALILRVLFPVELEALLRQGGLRVARRWGDFDESHYESASRCQILECTAFS